METRVSITIDGKQFYAPGMYDQENRLIVEDWASHAAQGTTPAVKEVKQRYYKKMKLFTYTEFSLWYSIRQHKTVFVPSVWITGDPGWVEVHGAYGPSITFGSVKVPVSDVKEGHGIFNATRIPPGEYKGFTVLPARVSSDESMDSSLSSTKVDDFILPDQIRLPDHA